MEKNAERLTMIDNKHTPRPFNRELFFSNFNGIEDMIPEIIECFLASIPKLTLVLETSLKSKKYEAIETSANTMKGFLGNFHAEPSRLLASQIEIMANDKLEDGIDEIFRNLTIELARLAKALQDLLFEISSKVN